MAEIINFPRRKLKPVVGDPDLIVARAKGATAALLELAAQSAADRAAGKLSPVMHSVRAMAELYPEDD